MSDYTNFSRHSAISLIIQIVYQWVTGNIKLVVHNWCTDYVV